MVISTFMIHQISLESQKKAKNDEIAHNSIEFLESFLKKSESKEVISSHS